MSLEEFTSPTPRRRDLAWWLGFTAVLIILTVTLRALPAWPTCAVALLFLASALQLRRGNLLRVIPVTLGVASAILATHAVVSAAYGAEGAEQFAEAGSLSLRQVLAGELWRIPAHAFLHSDWGHVRNNSLWLLGLGMVLEPALGSRRFGMGMLFTLATSSLATMPFEPGGYGFSGVGFGLLGMLLSRPYRMDTGLRRSLDPAWILAVWLLLRYLVPEQSSASLVFGAHAGGLIGGLWLGGVWSSTNLSTWDRRGMILRMATSSAVTLALVGALAMNSRWVVMWHVRAASHAEADGNLGAARRQWTTVRDLADPNERLGAFLKWQSMDYLHGQAAARTSTESGRE